MKTQALERQASTIDSNNSKKLTLVNLLMTFAIVIYHWKNFYMLNVVSPANETVGRITFDIFDVFGAVALRFFFFVSGFLLYLGLSDGASLKKKLKKRLYSLVIPFLVWNFLVLVWNFAYTLLTTRGFPDYRPVDYLLGFTLDCFCGPLWYILALIILLPLSVLLFKTKERRWLTTAVLATLTVTAFVVSYLLGGREDVVASWFSRFFTFVPVYCLGAWCGLYLPRAVFFTRMSKTACACAAVGLTAACLVLSLGAFELTAVKRICWLAIPTALWILISPSWLARLNITYPLKISFFVYAMHATLIGLLNTVLARVVGLNALSVIATLLVHTLLFVILYAICLGFAFACKKILPQKIYSVLSGGRA